MRTIAASAMALLMCALPATPAGAAACPNADDIPASAQALDDAAAAVRCLVNEERGARGLAPLMRDGDLAAAARAHASDMTARGYFSHVSRDGERLGDRLRDAGYGDPGDGWYAGEALGWGSGPRATPANLVQAFLDSPPHRRILLSTRYEEIGVGVSLGAPKPTPLEGATYALDLGTLRPG
jgi:uncharacterized protein YkwD